jgi:hypothetical protein
LVINEFRQGRWNNPDEILLDNGFVDPDGFAFGQAWVGYSFSYIVPYWLLCCVLSAIGLSSVQHKANSPSDLVAKSETTSAVERTTIPFQPVTLSFHDICYTVNASTSKEKLLLLKSVSGIFRSGRLCALMVRTPRLQMLEQKVKIDCLHFLIGLQGSSGAGKVSGIFQLVHTASDFLSTNPTCLLHERLR